MAKEVTPEERAIYIGERLFDLKCEVTKTSIGVWDNEYKNWLSSPDGLDAVEKAMIERGYRYQVEHEPFMINEWMAIFTKQPLCFSGHFFSKVKSETILTAAYNALKEEEKL